MAPFAFKEKDSMFICNSIAAEKEDVRDCAVYLLRDDSVVVLKNEPLNLMGPETLLFYRLGLERQALVI